MDEDHKTSSRNENGTVLLEDLEEGDPEMWKILNKSFKEVQRVLDRNRVLIRQVNENHQSKIPDNMVKNVDLICQINSNISHVVSLYSHLSSDFSTVYRRRQSPTPPHSISNNNTNDTPSPSH